MSKSCKRRNTYKHSARNYKDEKFITQSRNTTITTTTTTTATTATATTSTTATDKKRKRNFSYDDGKSVKMIVMLTR